MLVKFFELNIEQGSKNELWLFKVNSVERKLVLL